MSNRQSRREHFITRLLGAVIFSAMLLFAFTFLTYGYWEPAKKSVEASSITNALEEGPSCPEFPTGAYDYHRYEAHVQIHEQGLTVPSSEQFLLTCVDDCFKEYHFRHCVQNCVATITPDDGVKLYRSR